MLLFCILSSTWKNHVYPLLDFRNVAKSVSEDRIQRRMQLPVPSWDLQEGPGDDDGHPPRCPDPSPTCSSVLSPPAATPRLFLKTSLDRAECMIKSTCGSLADGVADRTAYASAEPRVKMQCSLFKKHYERRGMDSRA